jgi:flagellar basal-body rod protein FlgB
MDLIDTQTSRLIAKALDGISQRHKAISSNVANAETPGYKGIKVAFEESLQQAVDAENLLRQQTYAQESALKTTENGHQNASHTNVVSKNAAQQGMIERCQFDVVSDKSGIDIEFEMAQLAKNAGKYAALSRIESKTFASLKSVIKGGT